MLFFTMESHPLPQNVTTFQFKLVGDMTLKQFLYLATGASIAYALFVFARDTYPLVTWPLIVISALLGVAFAFLPVQSRPLDQWLAAFFRAVYTPTKRVWEKDKLTYKDNPLFKSRYLAYISGMTQNTGIPESQRVRESESQKSETPVSPNVSNLSDLPSEEELKQTVELAKQAQNLQSKIILTERQLNQIKTQAEQSISIPTDYTQQVNKILSDMQNLVNQASEIKQKLKMVDQTDQVKTIEAFPAPHEAIKPVVKVVVSEKPKQTQLALTTFPNVINGIIKDGKNNYLEAVVVVIYDKEGLPVRALKTNKLGQFTGATPLPNGTYRVELEKEGYVFDVLQIDLSGGVLSPLMIIAKQ